MGAGEGGTVAEESGSDTGAGSDVQIRHGGGQAKPAKSEHTRHGASQEAYRLHAGKAEFVMDANEIEKRLEKAILQLPEKQRIVFHLKYYEKLKYNAISEITGTSVGALKASYFHAVKKVFPSYQLL